MDVEDFLNNLKKFLFKSWVGNAFPQKKILLANKPEQRTLNRGNRLARRRK